VTPKASRGPEYEAVGFGFMRRLGNPVCHLRYYGGGCSKGKYATRGRPDYTADVRDLHAHFTSYPMHGRLGP
jgi:hypothetical protein